MIELVVGLTDKVSAPARNMRSALLESAQKVKGLQDRMKGLGKEIDELRAKQLKYREAGLTGVASQAGLEIAKLQLQMRGLGGELRDAKEHHAGLTKAMKGSTTGQKSFAQSVSSLRTEIAPYLVILAAYAAVLGVLAGVLYEGGKLAIGAVEFRDDTLMAFRALTGSAAEGRATLRVIRDLEREVPETEAQLVDRAKGLIAQGLDPRQLKSTLLDISNVTATLGEKGAQKVQNVIEKTLTAGKFKLMPKQLVGTGITEADLAQALHMTPATFEAMMKAGAIGADRGLSALHAVIDKKMGGTAAQQVGNMAGLANKLRDNLSHLFEDVDTAPFTAALKQIVDLFDTSKASGKAMKWFIEQVFNTGFSKGGSILLGVKHGIQDLIIGGLKLYIAMKPTIAEMKSLWAQAKKSEDLKNALLGIAIIVGVIALVVAVAAGALILLSAATIAVAAAIALGVGWVVMKVFHLSESMRKKFMGWGHMAKDAVAKLIDGLVHGISKGIARVQTAVHKLAGVLPQGLKDKLEIHSPSRVGERIGERFPEGVAVGMKRGEGRVGVAAARIGTRAEGDAQGDGGSRGGKGGHVDKVEIHNHGVDSEGKMLRITATSLADVLEQLALKEGLGLAT